MTDLSGAVVRRVFETGARVRHARVFHPRGIRLAGRFHATEEFSPWFGTGDRAVIARLSKGFGAPAGLPDVLGLAIRVLDRDDRPWDFALATTGRGGLGRFVVTPARGWARARFGSLMPYRFGDSEPVWVFADPLEAADLPTTTSLDEMNHTLGEDGLIRVELVADAWGRTLAMGELDLRLAEPGEHRTDFFDPMLNRPEDVTLLPELVSRLRERAYTGSRRGRGEAESS
ncbi:phosphodiesterase [Nocardia sp. AG03]|uniref:phosphodiesterase n=1 Tax=Nocardia sp. AG03 TaxID=3025312 RepID=UPI0024184475|nr:phosphodiesterase [Nocardia sp. AG03]